MQKLYVDKLQPGMVLGRTIFNDRRDVLLSQGVTLSPRYIDSLRALGLYAVYILDGISDDIEPPDIISEQVRVATYKHVRELFSVVQSAAGGNGTDGRRGAIGTLAATASPHLAQLYQDVERIVDEVMNADTLSGVTSLKSHDSYTFEHSIEVAVTGVMLGKRLLLSIHELHQLALGCLCHDIGKLVVPSEVLAKPGRLTAEEFAQVQLHPEAGYDMVQKFMEDSDIIARHVVWQHHERQDGSGYPRQLKGNNRYGGPVEKRFGQGLILPAAEIAAIADVYSALASDRPYRPAMAPPQIVSTLRQMSGKHLNRELLTRFLSILPTYPMGTDVVAISGKLKGHRGVVVSVNPKDVHRPTVRIVFDPSGRKIMPFLIDTFKDREIELASPAYSELAGGAHA